MSNLMVGGRSAMAGGPINQTSFIKIDPTRDGQILQCGVGDAPDGISQRFSNAPIFDPATTLPPAAVANQQVGYYIGGVPCQLQAGAVGWTRGQYLKPDANGLGVPVSASGDIAGARAQTTVNPGEIGQVDHIRYVKP